VKIGALVLQAGGAQLAGTILVVTLVLSLIGRGPNEALFLGAIVAMSSTAIVLKVYGDRGELDTPHGRVAMAVVLFQDLAVVPLLALIPLLGDGAVSPDALVSQAGALLGLVAMVTAGRWVVPWVLERIVGLRNRELFTLCIGFFGLAAAYLTASLGLSMPIGAFVAGLVISESEYGFQALSDVLPFRDAFSGIFFMSVGMLLDTTFVAAHPLPVLAAAVGIFVIKAGVVIAIVRVLRRSWEVSILAGFGLAQVGEFSFILVSAAPEGLIDAPTYQAFLGAAVLSMLAAPFAILAASRFVDLVAPAARRLGRELLPHEKRQIADLNDHAIIVGYGLAGRRLANVLKATGFPFVVLEQNGQIVRRARKEGVPMFFGDGSRADVLERVGVERARVLVFSISAPAEERRGVVAARDLNPPTLSSKSSRRRWSCSPRCLATTTSPPQRCMTRWKPSARSTTGFSGALPNRTSTSMCSNICRFSTRSTSWRSGSAARRSGKTR
jgi:monovalent cation:H+ antiporter-2, CPA2 family